MAEKFKGVQFKIENPYGEHGNSFSFTEVTPELIKKQLDSLDVEKATGLDVISPQFLKNEAPIICAPLAAIFNNSMLKGKISQSWKNTKVTPIFKAGDLTDVSNYRPISAIPVIMKIFERIVHNQQSNFPQRRHSLMLQNMSSMGSTQEN